MDSYILLFVLAIASLKGLQGTCLNKLPDRVCQELNKHNACKYKPVKMAVYCPYTCGYCKDAALTCAKMKCPPAKICVLDENRQPKCRCLVECSKKIGTGPLCGRNGKEYPDLCDLKQDECRTGDYILVKNYGPCVDRYECADAERESADGSCKAWQKTNACSSHPVLMRTYCPKTCGLCRQATEPHCMRSKFGCCWNAKGNFAAKGPYGAGCGGCSDRPFCRFFKNSCGGLRLANIRVMKKFCPFTCHYCLPNNLISG